jgi:hypothetical protein
MRFWMVCGLLAALMVATRISRPLALAGTSDSPSLSTTPTPEIFAESIQAPATATISASHCLPASAPSNNASVPYTSGHTYTWTVSGGGAFLQGGQGTHAITFQTGTSGTVTALQVIDSPGGGTSTATVQVDFADYGPSSSVILSCFYNEVCAIGRNGITVGCGSGKYCPEQSLQRNQMAVFLLKGEHGATYSPPPCTGIFADVPCPSLYAAWIEQLYNEGVTAGCGSNPLIYCPTNATARSQMAVFLIKMSHPPGYVPPPACGCVFLDVPSSAFAAAYIEQLSRDGHAATGYCFNCVPAGTPTPTPSPAMYFPNNSVTREQMAHYISATFNIS